MNAAVQYSAGDWLIRVLRGSRGLTRAGAAVVLGLSFWFPLEVRAQPAAAIAWSTNEVTPAGFGTNAGFRVRTDASGNVVVAATLVNASHGRTELAVLKYNSAGNRLWAAAYDHLDAHLDHWLAGLEVDQAGNVYLAGTAAAGPGGGDWVVVKYDAGGTRQWATNYGSAVFDQAVGLAVDERGFVAVAGNYAQGATIRAVRFDMLTGAVSGAVGVSPLIGTNRTATAMTTDAAGNVWVTGSSGGNCLTLRFAATGPGLVYSGKALSPAVFGSAAGQAIAWSPGNNLVFVLAAVQAASPPIRQAVMCYSNLPFPTIPLFPGWHAADSIPGTWLKPVISRPSLPTHEDPVAIAIAPGGRVVTLAQAATSGGSDWVVAGWNPNGSAYVETDSAIGPSSASPIFQDVAPAALATDPEGNLIVTGTGKSPGQDSDFATVRYAPLPSGTPLARHWFLPYDVAGASEQAAALAVDVAGNVLVTGASLAATNRLLSTIKVAQGPPLNDTCVGAQTLHGGAVAFSSRLATDTSPAVGVCNANRQDVWFKWTAPATGPVEMDTFGSRFDTVLAVYTGACGALTPVAGGCNDNATAGRPNGTAQSFVAFTATAGTTYRIQVGVGDAGQSGGDGRLTIFGPLPALGTCPPTNAPVGPWRKVLLLGAGTSATGGQWRLTVPGCMDLTGVTATSVGAPAAVLASNLAASINAACGPKVRAVAVVNAVFLQVAGCPPDEPVFLRIGQTNLPLNELCVLADAPPPGPLFPVAPPICSYNPTLLERIPVADCNGNTVPDEVDIASGVSQDTNYNQIPDECEGGLKLLQLGRDGVVLWGVPGYLLESSTDLESAAAWSFHSPASPVFVPFSESARYFRLRAAP